MRLAQEGEWGSIVSVSGGKGEASALLAESVKN